MAVLALACGDHIQSGEVGEKRSHVSHGRINEIDRNILLKLLRDENFLWLRGHFANESKSHQD